MYSRLVDGTQYRENFKPDTQYLVQGVSHRRVVNRESGAYKHYKTIHATFVLPPRQISNHPHPKFPDKLGNPAARQSGGTRSPRDRHKNAGVCPRRTGCRVTTATTWQKDEGGAAQLRPLSLQRKGTRSEANAGVCPRPRRTRQTTTPPRHAQTHVDAGFKPAPTNVISSATPPCHSEGPHVIPSATRNLPSPSPSSPSPFQGEIKRGSRVRGNGAQGAGPTNQTTTHTHHKPTHLHTTKPPPPITVHHSNPAHPGSQTNQTTTHSTHLHTTKPPPPITVHHSNPAHPGSKSRPSPNNPAYPRSAGEMSEKTKRARSATTSPFASAKGDAERSERRGMPGAERRQGRGRADRLVGRVRLPLRAHAIPANAGRFSGRNVHPHGPGNRTSYAKRAVAVPFEAFCKDLFLGDRRAFSQTIVCSIQQPSCACRRMPEDATH